MLVNSSDSFLGNYINCCSRLGALKSQVIGNDSSERLVHVGTLSEAVVRSALKLTYLWHKHCYVVLAHLKS